MRPSCKWEKNIKMGLKDRGWQGLTWINLVHDKDQGRAVVNTEMGSLKCKKFPDQIKKLPAYQEELCSMELDSKLSLCDIE